MLSVSTVFGSVSQPHYPETQTRNSVPMKWGKPLMACVGSLSPSPPRHRPADPRLPSTVCYIATATDGTAALHYTSVQQVALSVTVRAGSVCVWGGGGGGCRSVSCKCVWGVEACRSRSESFNLSYTDTLPGHLFIAGLDLSYTDTLPDHLFTCGLYATPQSQSRIMFTLELETMIHPPSLTRIFAHLRALPNRLPGRPGQPV